MAGLDGIQLRMQGFVESRYPGDYDPDILISTYDLKSDYVDFGRPRRRRWRVIIKSRGLEGSLKAVETVGKKPLFGQKKEPE